MSYGTWVFDSRYRGAYKYICSSCGHVVLLPNNKHKPHVCPECKDKMVDPIHHGCCINCEYLDNLICRLTGKYRTYDDPCNCADGGVAELNDMWRM